MQLGPLSLNLRFTPLGLVSPRYTTKAFVTKASITKPYANITWVTQPISLRLRSTSLKPMSFNPCDYGVVCH
jgi:hypothetical protein